MIEVIAKFMHLAPDAVGLPIFHCDRNRNPRFGKSFLYLTCKDAQTFMLCSLILTDKTIELGIFMLAAEMETEVFEFCVDIL